MELLVDQSAERIASLRGRYSFIGGQFQTPLSRYALCPDGPFAVDNWCYSNWDADGFRRTLDRLSPQRDRCLFVAVPDVVGSARRTLEVWSWWSLRMHGWPLALVAQDGAESLPIPWDQLAAVFIGGSTDWKMSDYASQIIKAAQLLGKRTHVGRVNTRERWAHFEKLGVDTADGTGVSRYDWMLNAIERNTPLLDEATA